MLGAGIPKSSNTMKCHGCVVTDFGPMNPPKTIARRLSIAV